MNDQIEMVFDTGHQVKIRLQHVGFQLQLCTEQLLAGSSADACQCFCCQCKKGKRDYT